MCVWVGVRRRVRTSVHGREGHLSALRGAQRDGDRDETSHSAQSRGAWCVPMTARQSTVTSELEACIRCTLGMTLG